MADVAVMESEADEIGKWLASVSHDPVRFVAEAFNWGAGELAGASGPEPWQTWVLEQIRDGLLTPGHAIRIAIASGHGVGKSALSSWITLWAMSTSSDCRGLITASSESMLMTRFRAELRTWFRRFRAAQFFELSATTLMSSDPDRQQTWRADLLPWNANRPEAFAGLHSKGHRILVIMDEASAIEPPIWETLEAVCTDADAEIIWLVAGNPLHSTGRFRDCFDKYSESWITKHVSSLSVSFTNKLEFARWERDYGSDSDFYRTRVLGEFPRTGSVQFIGPDLVDQAMNRELETGIRDPLVLGVDIARFGSDASVLYPRRGMDARSIAPLVFRNLPLDKLEDHIVAFANAHQVSEIFVDGTGVGGGVVDHLRRRGYFVHDIQFGSRADQMLDGVRYANKRCEIWGLLRNALRTGLCLPHNPALKEELTAPEYAFSRTTDAIQLESKDLMRRRGCASPDCADALACTFGAEIATLPSLSAEFGGGQVISEWDPFSSAALEGRPLPEATARYSAPGWAQLMNDRGWSQQDYQDAHASDLVSGER